MQFAVGKLVSLAGSKSLLAPLREHTLPFIESKDLLDSIMPLVAVDSSISHLSDINPTMPSTELKMQTAIVVLDELVA